MASSHQFSWVFVVFLAFGVTEAWEEAEAEEYLLANS